MVLQFTVTISVTACFVLLGCSTSSDSLTVPAFLTEQVSAAHLTAVQSKLDNVVDKRAIVLLETTGYVPTRMRIWDIRDGELTSCIIDNLQFDEPSVTYVDCRNLDSTRGAFLELREVITANVVRLRERESGCGPSQVLVLLPGENTAAIACFSSAQQNRLFLVSPESDMTDDMVEVTSCDFVLDQLIYVSLRGMDACIRE